MQLNAMVRGQCASARAQARRGGVHAAAPPPAVAVRHMRAHGPLQGPAARAHSSGAAAPARPAAPQQPRRARALRAAASAYARPGRHGAAPQPVVLKAPLGVSPVGPVEIQIEAYVPSSPPPPGGWPLALLSPGFLLNSSLYRSYAASLASWGFVVALVDLVSDGLLDDTLSAVYLSQGVDACARDPRLARCCDARSVLLVGHSRGAKISVLAAAQDPRVKGLALLDPVDSSSMGPQGPGFPSSLPALRAAAAQRRLPVLVVGAGANGDVVEPGANWRQFVRAAAGGGAPVWEVELTSCGHLQFLDKQMGLFSLFSSSGSTRDEDVRTVSQSAIAAWTQLAVLPAAGLAPPPPGGAPAAVAREDAALSRMAAVRCQALNLDALGAAAGSPQPQQQAQQRAQQQQQQQQAQQRGQQQARAALLDLSFEQLMGMRAKDLKGLLLERGVDSRGLFEKEELARRVLETCCRR